MSENTPKTTLKAINVFGLWVLVAFDILIFTAAVYGNPMVYLNEYWDKLIVLSVVGPILASFLNNLIPSEIKSTLVFWRLKHVLPSHRAFSKVLIRDTRIDSEDLKLKIGETPQSPENQNKVWFKVYKKHENNNIVSSSHRAFLLYRDFTGITCIFLIALIPLYFLFNLSNKQFVVIAIAYLTQYILVVIAARNSGYRFVGNVLRVESTE